MLTAQRVGLDFVSLNYNIKISKYCQKGLENSGLFFLVRSYKT